MTEQLKPLPCPFCGHIGLQFESGSTYRWGIASCDGCGATCGEVRRNYPDDGKWHAEAITEWNRRAQPAQAVPVLTDDEIKAEIRSRGQMVNGVKGDGFMQGARWAEQAVRAKMGVAQWLPIETAPVGKEMFVVRAFNVQVADKIYGYTSDAYGVWQPTLGRFERWPHPFGPTHWMPLPPPPGIVGKEGA